MAEAGPSSSTVQPASPAATPPSSSPLPQRSPRIHFPSGHGPSHPLDNGLPYSNLQSLGLGPPPALHKVGNQGGSLLFQQDDRRRRVRSVDASNGFEPSFRIRDGHPSSPSRRAMSFSRRVEKREGSTRTLPNTLKDAFSDEFDLYPGVLEDVQRALRLKARREARLRIQSSPLHVESHRPSDSMSLSSTGSSPGVNPNHPSFPRQPRVSGDSEIDFSPSIGVSPLHPIPYSLDGGMTLDWTTPKPDDGRERRWSLSRGKRKSKEQSSLTSKAEVEKQEATYVGKLTQIWSRATSLTKRKAEMISDQLQRKYKLLLTDGDYPTVNLLDVTRWYRRQDAQTRTILDKEEPSTWMKHLWDKHSAPRAGNSAWSPTALVMEEYVKLHCSNRSMETIPENEAILPISPDSATFSDARFPSASTYSWTTPHHSLEAAISRKRASYDEQVSFEPRIESGRESVGGDSRRNSDQFRAWKPTTIDSAHSSLYSILSKGASPNSSRKRLLQDPSKRITMRQSDEALSSARNSISENSIASDNGVHFGHQKMATVRPSRPTSLQLQAPPSPPTVSDANPPVNASTMPTPEAPSTATQSSTVFPDTAQPTPRPDGSQGQMTSHMMFPRRRHRRSLPSSSDIFAREGTKQRRSADEQKEREEYEIKAQVLEDTLSQNYRIRHLLQRVCTSIRDYDSVQTGLSRLLGISYTKIPTDVMDAFMHDPAAITGRTRRAESWRAVEDIHGRIDRQSRTLQSFINSLLDRSITPPQQIFDDPVQKLMNALEQLSAQRQDLVLRAEEVTAILRRVKTVHAKVKKDYNDALAHTSLVYPELSQIAALEENYRNQYQQFWDIGLDALTFLLDTVTPFWRNYGKVIGEDVQDFLIIPWYRNEFTGEPKRYPIKQFPRRSLRHWVGLVFLGGLSVSVTVLQFRAAVSLSIHINMPWIRHTGLWWIAFPIYNTLLIIQWCAVLIEICILVAQCGVIVWWMGWTINVFT